MLYLYDKLIGVISINEKVYFHANENEQFSVFKLTLALA